MKAEDIKVINKDYYSETMSDIVKKFKDSVYSDLDTRFFLLKKRNQDVNFFISKKKYNPKYNYSELNDPVAPFSEKFSYFLKKYKQEKKIVKFKKFIPTGDIVLLKISQDLKPLDRTKNKRYDLFLGEYFEEKETGERNFTCYFFVIFDFRSKMIMLCSTVDLPDKDYIQKYTKMFFRNFYGSALPIKKYIFLFDSYSVLEDAFNLKSKTPKSYEKYSMPYTYNLLELFFEKYSSKRKPFLVFKKFYKEDLSMDFKDNLFKTYQYIVKDILKSYKNILVKTPEQRRKTIKMEFTNEDKETKSLMFFKRRETPKLKRINYYSLNKNKNILKKTGKKKEQPKEDVLDKINRLFKKQG